MDKNNLNKAIELRHELHKIAELSEKEINTKKLLIKYIKENTSLEVIDKGLWFYAKYDAKSPENPIGFRADFDAISVDETIKLPYASKNKGVSHKCGHDGHAATLMGLALEIDKYGAKRDTYFVFQHAEEIGTGAKLASEIVLEKNIKEIYAYHNYPGIPLGNIGITDSTVCFASMGIIIKLHGVSSHASEPEKGINPAFAAANIINKLCELTSVDINKGLVLATVVQVDIGEEAFGVSAHEGKLSITLRAEIAEEMEKLKTNIEEFTKEQVEKYGLSLEIEYSDIFPETRNNKKAADKIRNIARSNGYNIYEMEALRTSEDYGYFLEKTKGAMMWIGAGTDSHPLHSVEYDFNDDLIEIAVDFNKLLIWRGDE